MYNVRLEMLGSMVLLAATAVVAGVETMTDGRQ